ncbi:hypothetical protein Nepgr_032230 [Nepenthes gracilis]|uniref:Uncharacterized protein n=1 Tax=Nepenthes gracilis TaxID=150966 RepID=A0AAD3Y5H4_NEPGR|nr:hypothetical protein Nepgr_032230 [Nepenthes gracilis]
MSQQGTAGTTASPCPEKNQIRNNCGNAIDVPASSAFGINSAALKQQQKAAKLFFFYCSPSPLESAVASLPTEAASTPVDTEFSSASQSNQSQVNLGERSKSAAQTSPSWAAIVCKDVLEEEAASTPVASEFPSASRSNQSQAILIERSKSAA